MTLITLMTNWGQGRPAYSTHLLKSSLTLMCVRERLLFCFTNRLYIHTALLELITTTIFAHPENSRIQMKKCRKYAEGRLSYDLSIIN